MIRKVPPPAPPAELTGDDSAAGRERKRMTTYLAQNGTLKGFKFAAYKEPGVVAELERVFDGKCAYCEHPYSGGAPPDVEHYRPKGGVEVDGVLSDQGYYWLAAEWTNLLPSCIDCNRQRYHDFPDIDPELRGKANKFPIGNPQQRAKKPGEEAAEHRLLLHPYFDDPTEHLGFITEGAVQAVNAADGKPSEMGLVSIRTYGLDRTPLSHARRDVWLKVAAEIKAVRKALARKARNPGNQDYEDMLKDLLELLKMHLATREPFLAMVRHQVKELEQLLT